MLAAVIRFIQKTGMGGFNTSPYDPGRNATSCRPMVFLVPVLVLGLLIGPMAQTAQAVDLDIGEASGIVGDTVLVEITTEDLTGLNVYSYELTITWYADRATVIDAPVSGTITEPWGAPTVNSQPGRIDVASAGTSPLAGAGTLIYLQFILGPTAANANLSFDNFMFNEGDPADTLSNGYLYISAAPSISINPNSGEVAVGDSLEFSTAYGTPPYTYGTTDEAIGDFTGTDHLKGISPGAVYAFVEDDNGITDTTTSQIYVRALKLTAGNESGTEGNTVLVPMTITDPSTFGIKSAEFTVTYNENDLTAIGTSDAGTIAEAAGWSSSVYNVSDGRIDVSMAGTTDLAGPGVLVYIEFLIDDISYNKNVTLYTTEGMFNEVYPPVHVNGNIYATALPTISITPDTKTIVVGDELQFSVSGSTTPPLNWGVTEPALADIDATGNLTALSSGATRVFVVDDVGATDTTSTIYICDLYVVAPDETVHTVFPDAVPISPDRDVTGLGIYSYEMTFSFNDDAIEIESVTILGTLSEGWGTPTINTSVPGYITIVNAGSTPLAGSLPFFILNIEGLPGYEGYWIHIYFENVLFNEGEPCALTQDGTVRIITGVDDHSIPRMRLDQNYPNPFNPSTVIRYSLGQEGQARLQIFTLEGKLVRTLVDRYHDTAGPHEAIWNGFNNRGGRVSSGVYFYRLEAHSNSLLRKMVLLR
ncbi:MAG: Ig-like domain-containing protein [bacterium]|nr:MAG: Ig-like domain-containing protein [bacterium]